MKIRFGYVAIALKLGKITTSSNLTFARYKTLSTEKKLMELKRVTRSNVEALEKILKYNGKNNIHFYRITSKLIPLATHPEVEWDFERYFCRDLKIIGNIVKKYNMRVDTHPDQFNVLNSIKEDVIEKTIKNLMHHNKHFECMEYPQGKMVIHIGSSQGGKKQATKRLIENFHKLPDILKGRLIFENDDKTFTAKEVLDICDEIKAPMVLDIHHHLCNNKGEKIKDIIKPIFDTWEGEYFPPKIHISSPKEGGNDRKHADYIRIEDFIGFIEKCQHLNRDFDVMIEAKKKDLAMFNLIEKIKENKPEWKWIDETTLEI
ncbi:UV DNA damage repair endonuclease UvsE [Anaeromicrobium sediminis]|uniref:UV damage repair endonuclease UvsE n=1 Tax=Anaeromicrobium sediminis TaxID=1478221 RepID=A0A267MAZ5_9FIRM|nr:UV DNA damage repair endonuclease UvsE [Anaeromicrobium sediminis]PAB56726.1 UV damage repair endonuclease UvsE [Anaeromicrobium sediminis]